MRILLTAMLCLALGLLAVSLAGTARAGGFEGPGVAPAVGSAAAALATEDDAPCVLEGYILEKLPGRKDRYLFADQSGQVVVEIERGVFGQQTVTPKTRVRLVGEVEWDSKRPNEVEVDELWLIP